MMKKTPVALLCVFMASLLPAAPSPPQGNPAVTEPPKSVNDMTPEELMQVLNRANLLARPYYNGVPDPNSAGRGYGEKKKESRADVLGRLAKIIIPHVSAVSFNQVTMDRAVPALTQLIRNADDGNGFNFSINQFLVAGGASGGTGATGSDPAGMGNMGIFPMGNNGMPFDDGGMDDGMGDPLGLPPLGGQPPALGQGGLPLPMPNGLNPGGPVGMGGGNSGAFNPKRVLVQGFVSDMYNVSALDLLNHLCLSFDHKGGIEYQIMPVGIVLVERSPNNVDPNTGAPLFSRVIAVRPNLFGGKELPKPTTGGGQQGGQSGGGMGGGMMGGGMGMPGMGGGMGMNPMMGGGMGGMGMNPMMGGGMGGMGMNPMMGGGMGMNPMMGGGMGGMGGGMYRYRRGSRAQQVAPQPQNLQNRYRSFNFRRR
ncbi:MAG: hypothetical protein QGG55_11035 [Verrucomicrobiota bacterium]|nr:hypothetical protein [Verrucomicrobiota bacterium]